MARTVTESIYDVPGLMIPLAEVQYIRTAGRFADIGEDPAGIHVYLRGGGNRIAIPRGESEKFAMAWCRYRSELEAETLMDLSPEAPQQQQGVTKLEQLVASLIPVAADYFGMSHEHGITDYNDWKSMVVNDAIEIAEMILNRCEGR